jgi:hypothetical protein
MGRVLYVLFGLLIIGGYAYASVRGMELTTARTRMAPGGVRGAHGRVLVRRISGRQMMDLAPALRTFLSTLGYTVFGVIVFALACWAMVKISPFSISKEIEADQNVALAILMASVILGLAIIIAAALHG